MRSFFMLYIHVLAPLLLVYAFVIILQESQEYDWQFHSQNYMRWMRHSIPVVNTYLLSAWCSHCQHSCKHFGSVKHHWIII